jgi:hypothetical protein
MTVGVMIGMKNTDCATAFLISLSTSKNWAPVWSAPLGASLSVAVIITAT